MVAKPGFVEARRIPSLPHYAATRDGRIIRLVKGHGVSAGKELKSWPHGVARHRRVKTSKGHRFVHRLVCEAFHGPPPPGKPHALHRDDDTTNNTPGNLYWGTTQDNANDRKRNGIRVGRRTHSEETVQAIKALLYAGISERKTAEKLGVNRGIVRSVARGRRGRA